MGKPILFNSEMINAILDGRKSQTRRIIKPQPLNPKWSGSEWIETGCDDTKHFVLKCSYKVGMRLWVRETFITGTHIGHAPWVRYRATDEADIPKGAKWSPSIFMPRWASRISLEIVDMRVERIQDISEDDAWDEGINEKEANKRPYINKYGVGCATAVFSNLWESINGKRGYGWAENPWVWAISFKKEGEKVKKN